MLNKHEMFWQAVAIIAFIALLFLWASNFLGCGAVSPLIDPNVTECEKACTRLEEMLCPGWKGSAGPDEQWDTDDDLQCVEICTMLEADEMLTIHPECVARAMTCTQVDRCFDE